MSLSPSEISLRARIGGYAQKARHDPRETTQRARETFLSNFSLAVDPEGVLPPAERELRALAARKAHFPRLAFKSAQVRGKRRAAGLGPAARMEGKNDATTSSTPSA